MRATALVFITLIVGSFASPALPVILGELSQRSNEQRIVTGQIVQAIEDLAQSIRDAGLDPYRLTDSASFELPVPVIFNTNAFVDSLIFTGLSDIAINNINFSILTNRLTFNLSLPRLFLSIGSSGYETVFFGDEYTGSLSGSLDIIQLRLIGNIRVNVGVVSGISIRSIDFIFSLDRISSNLDLSIGSLDLSSRVNTYLGSTVPAKLREYANEINELLEAIAWQVIEEIM